MLMAPFLPHGKQKLLLLSEGELLSQFVLE